MASLPDVAPCAPYLSIPYSPYGYLPSLPAGIIFSILFGLITAANLLNTIRTKYWWMGFFLTAGALLETIGWVGRTVAHECVYNVTLSTMQISTLIMGPAYTQTGVYIALWLVLNVLGTEISPVPPKIYLVVVFLVDCVCLLLQAIGGGIAGAAFESGASTQLGTDIMVAGIISQLVSGCVFLAFLGLVVPRAWRRLQERENRRLALTMTATVVSTVMMVLRGFYRSVELCQGWRGYLITNQGFVVGLDAVPMVVAMGGLAILNPGVLLRGFEMKRTDGLDMEKDERIETSEYR
ncbi:RTA1 like protein-domain-containing protein [Mycena albidolilacea]|uniref:RTA1 like protein-domain-containing protein n=1 Tax=Mycena albidolilacea TaxID=1033008 RepID=A0AAD7AIJ1_9AGAR|nr:RTA1 like protein-domain-containing protein [Mycena albidolilacea]